MKKSSITAQGTLQRIHVSYYKQHNYTARLQWSQNVRLIRFKGSRIPCQIKTTRMGVTMPLTMLRRQRSSFVYEHKYLSRNIRSYILGFFFFKFRV